MFDWPKNREKKHLAKKVLRQRGAAARIRPTQLELVVKWLALLPPRQARPGSGLAICIFTLWIKIKTVGARRAPPRGRDATTATTRAATAAAKAIDECWRQMQNVPAGGSHETEIPSPLPPCGSAEAR